MKTFDPADKYDASDVAELLAITEKVATRWLREHGHRSGAAGEGLIKGAELARLWRAGPARVAFSAAPLTMRVEITSYAKESITAYEAVQRLVNLITFMQLPDLDALWTIDAPAVRRWVRRPLTRWTPSQGRDERQEVRYLRGVLGQIATARGRPLPTWVGQILPVNTTVARSDPARWVGHPWESDLNASLAQIRGTRAGAAGRLSNVRVLAFHAAAHAKAGMSLGEALCDPTVVCDTFRALRDASRARRGSWRSATEKHLLEALRPILCAGATGGSLSSQSSTALARLLVAKATYQVFEVPEMVKNYRRWARAELRRAGIRPEPGERVHPPSDEEARTRLQELARRLERLLREHERRGLSLDDYRRWREWSPELRDALCAGLAAPFLAVGGERGGSLHGQQPVGLGADDTYPGAVRSDRILVKRVAHEGADGITTSHDNRPYDLALAPEAECSTWIVLPLSDFPYKLRDLLEWYLHACGQCLGRHNRCDASNERVVRWITLGEEHGRWAYREQSQGHVPGRVSFLSKDGEWLATLRAPTGKTVLINPLWWSRDGSRPILQEGLADRLVLTFGQHLHRWRHYALFYLITAYGLSLDEAALLIHMDPQTAALIYNNPTDQQILARLRVRMATQPQDGQLRELLAARDKVAFLSAALRERDHQLAYLATVFGPLPQPPEAPGAILGPAPTLAAKPKRRARPTPRGGDAFAA